MMTEREKITKVINDFHDAGMSYYGSHAYSAGYLGSLLAGLLMEMRKEDQDRYVRWLLDDTVHMQKQALNNLVKEVA